MATSPDGVTWTDRTAPMAGYWSNGAVGDGLAVITSQNGGLDGIVSTDGITWTVKTTVSGGSYQGVAYGKQSFVSIKYETNKVARLLR